MSPKRLALVPSLLLAACSQPTKQPVPASHDAAAPAEPAAGTARSQEPTRAGTDLGHAIAIARACAEQRPGGLVGASGTPLILDEHFVIVPLENGTWRVTFTEQEPTARPYGRSFEVDPEKDLCDGAALDTPAGPSRWSDAGAVLAKAEKCAREAPFDGLGVCDSALRFDRPTIHHLSEISWVVSFPEESPRCAPQGRDLIISADASSCSPAPMD